MANKVKLVSNTRIYLDTRALMDEILDVTPNFPRSYKYTIGSKLHDLATEIIQEIAAAYMNRDRETRIAHLVDFQIKFETIKTLLRIAGERQWIKGKGRHAHIVELLDAIGKQSSAWKKSLIEAGKAEIKTKSPELESYD